MDAIPVKRALFTAAVYAGLTVIALAQPPGPPQGGRGGPPGGGPRGGGGMGALLRSDEVRAELELLDDQVEQLRELESEMRDRIRSEMRDAFGGERGERRPRGERGDRPPRGERGDRGPRGDAQEGRGGRGGRGAAGGGRGGPGGDMRAKFEEIREEMEGRLAEILSTQQMERLQQINAQQQMKNGGARALMGGPMADALNLTDEQKEMLREKAQEVRAAMEEKMEAARNEAREELMGILTSEQRATLDSLMGEPFTMSQPQRRGGFDRGQRGGRGGPPEGGGRRGGRGGPPPRDGGAEL